MKSPAEKISLLIMRDNGEVRSVRLRRSLLYTLLFVCAVLPFALGAMLWFGVDIWLSHRAIVTQFHAAQQEYLEAKATAARLADLERLLHRADPAYSAQVLQNVRRAGPAPAPTAQDDTLPPSPPTSELAADTIEGPGHSEFPTLNLGKVQVENVHIRLMPRRNLRISLDLSNPDPTSQVAGKIVCTLTTATGQTLALRVFPQAADDFRITRFKRVVLTSPLPPAVNTTDAQVVLEIKPDGGGAPLFRNVYAVVQ